MTRSATPAPRWVDIEKGLNLPPLRLELSVRRVVLTPAYTFDPFPGHYDVEYARSIGHPTIFMNTMPLLGLLDRVVTDWAGPDAVIVRHSISLRAPAYAGMTLSVDGHVVDKRRREVSGDWPATVVEVAAKISADGRACASGEVTVALR